MVFGYIEGGGSAHGFLGDLAGTTEGILIELCSQPFFPATQNANIPTCETYLPHFHDTTE